VLLRSAKATVAVGAVLGISATVSMAVAGWLGYPLSPSAVAAPMIVVTVAIADGVHVVLAYMEAAREGRSRDEAIAHAVSSNLEAVTYTWLTTIVGFVCLNYSDAPPVAHLANMTCVGVTLAFVLSFTLLPALLSALRVPVPAARAASATPTRLESALASLASFVMRRRAMVLGAGALLTLGLGVQASKLETNDQFVGYFDRSIDFRRDVEFTMKNLSGIYRLEYAIESGEAQGVTDPAYLGTLERFATYLRAQPEVEHVLSLTDIVKRVHQVTHGDAAEAYALPASRGEAGEELMVYEMSLPAGLDLSDRVTVDKAASRLTVTVKDLSTRDLTAFARRSEEWLQKNAPRPMWSQATGPVVIFSQLGDRNAKSMLRADLLSIALISLCMILVLRSLELGLLSVVPNLVPIVFGYGVWRMTVGQMNIVATIAGSISLGVIVDDTIHFLSKYRATLRKGTLTEEEAMRHTLAHVGPAMLGTSVVLMAGFGVLTLSAFQMTSYLGWLSLLIVGIAPLADLVLAPALVSLTIRRSSLTRGAASAAAPSSGPSLDEASLETGAL
jgi:predicted RND superfamily exporter protein